MREWLRPTRLSLAVYVIAISLAAILLLIGWIVRENAIHNRALQQQQEATIQFLRSEVCARLLLRDEIQIRYLTSAYLRYLKSDPDYAGQLLLAIEGLRFTKDGCINELPE